MTPEEIQAQEATAKAEQEKKQAEEKSKQEADDKAKAEADAKAKDEVPVGDLVEKPEEKKENLIPESVFLGEKKARKALEKEVKDLKALIESGATKEEISEDISAIAEEHNVDKVFLQKLASSIKKTAEKELNDKFSEKFDKKEKNENFETAFTKAYATAIERAPEFVEIANTEVIKTLSLQPQNAKKTISQLLEETYGNALTGKRTIEKTVPGGGKDPEPLDFAKASKDIEYFKQVMADPKLKAQYNEQMLKKGF